MKKLVLASLILPLLSGCFLYDCGYTRNDDTAIYKTDAFNKMPITYSLKFNTSFDPLGGPTEKSLRTKIEETLKATGLFSEVVYGDKSEKGYHLEFSYNNFVGPSQDDRFAMALIFTFTLYTIPNSYMNVSSDLSAILYIEGNPIWSVAHTEKCRYIGWIGALPVGFVLNHWSVWRSIEYNIVRSTVNDLTREHIRRYLDPSSVELTNPEDVGASNAQP